MAEQAITAADAVKWVDQNKGLIVVRAKKYLPFTPYDRDDFVQDAYEAAIVAACIAERKNLAFEACFWTVFNRHAANVVPNPLSTSRAGSVSPPTTICSNVEKFAQFLTAPEQQMPWHDVDRLYLAICGYLSESENKVWIRALGITPTGRMSNYEIAEDLGCSAANVRQAIQRVVARLSKKVKAKTLHISRAAVETRHLRLVSGQATKSSGHYIRVTDEETSLVCLAEVG
jgi:RNA polymerase sigma factor (sigma-70 family)